MTTAWLAAAKTPMDAHPRLDSCGPLRTGVPQPGSNFVHKSICNLSCERRQRRSLRSRKIANANIQKEAGKTNLQSCTCFFLRVKITPTTPFENVHNFLGRGLLVNRLNLSYLIVCPRFLARSGLHTLTEILEKASIHSQC